MNHVSPASLRRLAATAILAFAAVPAHAECLDASDLGRGVVVRYANGDFTTIRRLNDGYLQVEEAYADGSNPVRFRAHRGIYFVQEFEVGPNGQPVPDTQLDIVFDIDPARLPEPVPGVTWEGPTVNIFANGSTRNEITSVRYSAAPDLMLSGCSYTAVQSDLRYDWGPDGGLTLRYLYLPAVGTALIVSNQFDGDTLNTTEPVGLELAAK